MNLRRSVVPLTLAAAGLGALLLTFDRYERNLLPALQEGGTPPRYTVSDADLTRYDADGTATLRGHASSIEYFDDDSGHAVDVSVDLLEDNAVAWHLTSDTAVQPAHERRILLDSPVVASGHWPDNGEAVTIDSSQVWIDPDAHIFQSQTPVSAQSKSRQGTAVGMLADWQTQRLRLLHDVKMTYVAP